MQMKMSCNANGKMKMKMYARYGFVPSRLTLHLIYLHSKEYGGKSNCTKANIPHGLSFKVSENSCSPCRGAKHR